MTSGSFEGKIAVVTGATQGVGEAVARLFAERGAAGLVIVGRSLERGEEVARAVSGLGCPTEFVPADLERVPDAQAVIDHAERHFERIHVLANCAGATDRGSLETTSEAIFDRLLAVNVKAPFFLTQRAAAVMKKHRIQGAIANIGTIVAHGGPPFLIPYSTSKGALMTMTRGLANALRFDRIRVNTLNIGWSNTPNEHVVQTEVHGRPDDWLAQIGPSQPFGRLIEVDEIARAMAFLCSDESGVMTGAVIDYDQTVIGTMDENPGG